MSTELSYAVVTPAHNEAVNIRRLAECMRAQTSPPVEWMIVDNGSTDDTAAAAAEITETITWARSVFVPKNDVAQRGAPVVFAFQEGLAALESGAAVVVKLDADVTFDADFFAVILQAFAQDPRLGIAGGMCYELDAHGVWKPDYVTRGHVRGATRAYRAECLADVLPLEPRMGWDGIDELRARLAGWDTRSLDHLPFMHRRPLGAREAPWQKWVDQGRMAHYMGYAPLYLAARTAFRSVREPRAVAMLWGYAEGALRREPRYPDSSVRDYLRRQQSLVALPTRIRESLGRASR